MHTSIETLVASSSKRRIGTLAVATTSSERVSQGARRTAAASWRSARTFSSFDLRSPVPRTARSMSDVGKWRPVEYEPKEATRLRGHSSDASARTRATAPARAASSDAVGRNAAQKSRISSWSSSAAPLPPNRRASHQFVSSRQTSSSASHDDGAAGSGGAAAKLRNSPSGAGRAVDGGSGRDADGSDLGRADASRGRPNDRGRAASSDIVSLRCDLATWATAAPRRARAVSSRVNTACVNSRCERSCRRF